MVRGGVGEARAPTEALVTQRRVSLATGASGAPRTLVNLLASLGPARSSLLAPDEAGSHLPLPCLLPRAASQVPAQILKLTCTRGETPIPVALAPQRPGFCRSQGWAVAPRCDVCPPPPSPSFFERGCWEGGRPGLPTPQSGPEVPVAASRLGAEDHTRGTFLRAAL